MSVEITQDFAEFYPATTSAERSQGFPNPQEIIFQAGLGYVVSACLHAAVRLRIPDLIGEGYHTLKPLAMKARANETYLFRLLRVLEANQIVAQPAPGHFTLTLAGQLLRRDSSESLAGIVDWITDPLHLTLYSKLQGSIETGSTTFDANYGMGFFDWLSQPENAEEAVVFNDAMTNLSEACIPAFLDAFSFGDFSKIIDVGGGHGALLRAILHENPGVKGVVAEMPSVVPETRRAIQRAALSERCEAVECNFFQEVPEGGDCYFMKHIIHDWADKPALQLLRNIRAVIPPTGKLVLAEMVLDDSAAPHLGKLLDIEMLAFVGGKERTEREFRELLAEADFVLERIVPTKSPLCLLEASPY